MRTDVRVELLSAPGCPNVEAARKVVEACLVEAELDTVVVEHVGRYRSPTVLVDGADVMGVAADEVAGDACRLDLPTRERVLEALRAARISPLTVDSLCPTSTFHAAAPDAAKHLKDHPELRGTVLSQYEAIERCFGSMEFR